MVHRGAKTLQMKRQLKAIAKHAPQGPRPQSPATWGCAPEPVQWLRFLVIFYASHDDALMKCEI